MPDPPLVVRKGTGFAARREEARCRERAGPHHRICRKEEVAPPSTIASHRIYT